MDERNQLRDGVPRHALKLPFRGHSVRELAIEALKISACGLKNRRRLNRNGDDEALFLHPLMEIALANETPAERKLALYHGVWQGDIDHIFKQFAY
jgi:glutamate--cysteine ligase